MKQPEKLPECGSITRAKEAVEDAVDTVRDKINEKIHRAKQITDDLKVLAVAASAILKNKKYISNNGHQPIEETHRQKRAKERAEQK
jgi:ABC-type transporter Mla subunit MlaD